MLKVKRQYRVKGFDKSMCRQYRHKLISMGILPGATFFIVRYAPLGDTLQIEINDFYLSLRQSELKALKVELVDV